MPCLTYRLSKSAPPLLEAGLVERTGDEADARWLIHPGIAARRLATVDPGLRTSIDQLLASLWMTIYQMGQTGEERGSGEWVARAGLAAAPYLLRLENWSAASSCLEHVLMRDESSATAATVLPWLRTIAAATTGTADELGDRLKLARALRSAGQTNEARAELQRILALALEQKNFRVASATVGDLANLIMQTGQLDDALELVVKKIEYSSRAGLGPWTQLADEGRRLAILSAQGEYEKVLKEVPALRRRIAKAPPAGPNETAIPWNVRETILDTGRAAAVQLRQWKRALQLNELVRKSQQSRGADRLQLAKTDLNDHLPLVELGQYGPVRALLDRCRETFELEADVEALGSVFSAMGSLEHSLHGPKAAIPFTERAMRYQYNAGLPGSCATCHFNFSNYVLWDHGPPPVALAHRLAAIAIGLLMQSNMLYLGFNALVVQIIDLGPRAREAMPANFEELRAIVDQIEGVNFEDLINSINSEGSNLDGLVHALVAKGFELAEGPK